MSKPLIVVAGTAALGIAIASLWGSPDSDDVPKPTPVSCEFELPDGFASDEWVVSEAEDAPSWKTERDRRRRVIDRYLSIEDADCAKKLGFSPDQNPKLAWEYFTRHPIGYGGVPLVLLKTLLSLDPVEEADRHRILLEAAARAETAGNEAAASTLKKDADEAKALETIARIWKKPSPITDERTQDRYTLDHLGMARPVDSYDKYSDAYSGAGDAHRLPNGLVFDPNVEPKPLGLPARVIQLLREDWRSVATDPNESAWKRPFVKLALWLEHQKARSELSAIGEFAQESLREQRREYFLEKLLHVANYDEDIAGFQKAPPDDAVFFACSACHQGRVFVDDEMVFADGMPNTEIEAQYFSQLLMETGFALLEDGWDETTDKEPTAGNVLASIDLDWTAIRALHKRLIARALDDTGEVLPTIYGGGDADEHRAVLQTYHVAAQFPKYVMDLVGIAIKTQYIYWQIAKQHSFKGEEPALMSGRTGQMDAFGIASGLVAIHTYRPDNSFIRFLCRDNPDNPLFELLETEPGPDCDPEQLAAAAEKIRSTLPDWAPSVPAPIDIPTLSWMKHRVLANWDGNQGAAARTLASGTSATGDPTKVNVRVHEPLNPMLNYLPPTPYPFDDVDRVRARRGRELFYGRDPEFPDVNCAECHVPQSDEIVPITHDVLNNGRLPLTVAKNLEELRAPTPCEYPNLCVDGNRAIVNTPTSRYALAGIVMEACMIFVQNTGNDWCLPHDERGRLILDWDVSNDDYFKNTPGRVALGEHGYKVDMQHGIWARAPYLHNGSVPTLGHLLCPETRPDAFIRGQITEYDTKLVGFQWAPPVPDERLVPGEAQQIKLYETDVVSRSNRGHEYGWQTCRPRGGRHINQFRDLDAVDDRDEITRLILQSAAGDLIEYMKTF